MGGTKDNSTTYKQPRKRYDRTSNNVMKGSKVDGKHVDDDGPFVVKWCDVCDVANKNEDV